MGSMEDREEGTRLIQCSVVTYMSGMGVSGREVSGRDTQKEGDICIHIADSLHCTAETSDTIKHFYSNLKKKSLDGKF